MTTFPVRIGGDHSDLIDSFASKSDAEVWSIAAVTHKLSVSLSPENYVILYSGEVSSERRWAPVGVPGPFVELTGC